MAAPRVLVIDDDTALCELLVEYLADEGFDVETAHDGMTGAARAVEGRWDLVVLDVMIPGRSGLDVLRDVRRTSAVPVVMLTARGEEVDRIVGLELGADDYLPKPFNPRELVARIRAVLRRATDVPDRAVHRRTKALAIGDLVLDAGARSVRRNGEEVVLTGVEFSLLETLLRAAGELLSREELYREVLGRRGGALDRSLDVHVSALRKKLGPQPGGGERIKTVRGLGYQYALPGAGDDERDDSRAGVR
jgi:two-component system response regulator CpxR